MAPSTAVKTSQHVRTFPDAAPVVRLVGALMLGQDDKWAVSYHYMSSAIAVLSDAPRVSLPAVAA